MCNSHCVIYPYVVLEESFLYHRFDGPHVEKRFGAQDYTELDCRSVLSQQSSGGKSHGHTDSPHGSSRSFVPEKSPFENKHQRKSDSRGIRPSAGPNLSIFVEQERRLQSHHKGIRNS